MDDSYNNGFSEKERNRRAENYIDASISRGNYWAFVVDDGSIAFFRDNLIAISNGVDSNKLINLNTKNGRDEAVKLIIESMGKGFVYHG